MRLPSSDLDDFSVPARAKSSERANSFPASAAATSIFSAACGGSYNKKQNKDLEKYFFTTLEETLLDEPITRKYGLLQENDINIIFT